MRSGEIVACKTCRDFGKVYDGPKTVPCPECSVWPEGHRAEMLREATKREAEKPSITETDLSDDERALMAQWAVDHPHVHRLTLLTWIEGRRYLGLEVLSRARLTLVSTSDQNDGPTDGEVSSSRNQALTA